MLYAKIQDTEITKLAELKASGLVTQIYLVLAAHDHRDGTCFPSLQTICNKLANAYHPKSIIRGLKWLEDNNLIVRSEPTSKTRFTLLMRKIKEAVTKTFRPEPNGNQNTQRKERNNKNTYYSKYQARSRSQNKITNHKKIEDKIYDWLNDVGSIKSTIEFHQNPSNKAMIEQFKLTPTTTTLPTTRPKEFCNKAVYKVIRDRGWGLPENSWIWPFYQSLSPA